MSKKGAFLSGVLIGTSYVPFPPWALVFCFLPLWLEVLHHRESFWKSFYRAWWTQFVLSIIGFYWIAYVSHEYGYMPWPVAVLVALLFAASIHLYIPFTVAAVQWLRQKNHLSDFSSLMMMATGTALGEIYWPRLFPWNFGYTLLWSQSPIAQVADVIGFQGLSFLILVLNALLAWTLLQRKTKIWILYTAFSIFILGALHFWGQKKIDKWSHPTSQIRVLQIQANIGNAEKIFAEKGNGFQQYIATQFFNLTEEALKKDPNIDLIIWPESAFPDFLDNSERFRVYSSQFYQFIQKIKKPILTGAYSRDIGKSGRYDDYNALFLINPEGQILGTPYRKTYLLIFGEFTPFSDIFPWLAKISPAGDGWQKGHGPQIIPFGNINIGPQICYESLYPEFSSKLSNLGAHLLINITNDSWFGATSEPYQHMIMTMARAIETRRPLLRTTNTGITTAILANGTQLEKSPLFQTWSSIFTVSYSENPEETFYSQYGNYFPLVLIFILLILLFLGRPKESHGKLST